MIPPHKLEYLQRWTCNYRKNPWCLGLKNASDLRISAWVAITESCVTAVCSDERLLNCIMPAPTLLTYLCPFGAASSLLVCLHVPWYTRGLIGSAKFGVCVGLSRPLIQALVGVCLSWYVTWCLCTSVGSFSKILGWGLGVGAPATEAERRR